MAKEELGNHFATQPWSDEANARMAFETLTEPSYIEPREPDIPVKLLSINKYMATPCHPNSDTCPSWSLIKHISKERRQERGQTIPHYVYCLYVSIIDHLLGSGDRKKGEE